MISEETQEQASLYVLGLLDAAEAAAFERERDADTELRTLVSELRETTAAMAASAEGEPPPALKARVLARVKAETRPAPENYPVPGNVVAGPWSTRLPWALAAMLMICCGVLAVSRERWRRDFSALERKTAAVEVSAEQLRVLVAATPKPAPEVDALQRVAFCPLEPLPQAPAQPRAAVLWDMVQRKGKLRVTRLPPPGKDKDYQLWVVETGHKETVSAGVVPVGAEDSVEVPFQPVPEGGKEPVVAFAISLERAGGSPKNEGPVLFLGKL